MADEFDDNSYVADADRASIEVVWTRQGLEQVEIDATNQGLDMFGVFKHGRIIAQQSQDEVTNIVNDDEDDDDDDVTY